VIKVLGIIVGVLALAALGFWLKLRAPDIPYETLDAKYVTAASRFVDLPGDIRLHYRDEGDPNAPLLVLLHGYGDSYTTWEGWVATLKDQYHILSLDFPGHGLTRAPQGYRLSGDALADLVNVFAARLKLPKFAVAGNSMGGGVAWRLAVRHPDSLNALVLVDAAAFPPSAPPKNIPLAFKILQYSWGRALLASIDNSPLIDQGLKMDVYDPTLITPALVARWAEFQRAPGHRDILMSGDVRGLSAATTELVSKISVPTLVIHGESDVLIEPASSKRLAESIPGAQLILYPKVGHLPQLEIPQQSATDVAAFLKAHPT
jgi:pimeloyl-ACP methyl ester carboxylesterase